MNSTDRRAKHCFRLMILIAVIRLLSAEAVGSWQWGNGKDSLAFSKPSADLLKRGKDQVEALHSKSKGEGFLDVMLGTNCYTSVVRNLEDGCQALDADASMWLAFHLANCLWTKTGRRTYSGDECTLPGHDAASCISQMTGEDYIVFIQFLQNVHTMCMFIANADFQERAEAMLNNLFVAGTEASMRVAHVQEGLDQQALVLKQMNGELHALGMDQQHLSDGIKASISMLDGLQSTAAHLSQRMQRSEEANAKLLQAEEAVSAGLAQMRQEQLQHAHASQIAWQAAEDQAKRVTEWQEQYEQFQEKIITSTAAMTKASDGVKLAVNVVESAQRRGNSALATLLGTSYRVNDLAFYFSGFMTLLVVGWNAQMRQAWLPISVLYLLCAGIERSLLAWLSPRLQLGMFDQPVLQLPWPLAFLLGSVSVDHIKFGIRASFSLVVVAVLIRSLWTRQPDAAWERVLHYLLDLEARQSQLWQGMEERILIALQNMCCSRSSSHNNDGEVDIIARGHSTGQVICNRARRDTIQTRRVLDGPVGSIGSRGKLCTPAHGLQEAQHAITRSRSTGRQDRKQECQGHVEPHGGGRMAITAPRFDSKQSISAQPPPLHDLAQGPASENVLRKPELGQDQAKLRRSERISGSLSHKQRNHSGGTSTSLLEQKELSGGQVPCTSGAASAGHDPNLEQELVGSKRSVHRKQRITDSKKTKFQ